MVHCPRCNGRASLVLKLILTLTPVGLARAQPTDTDDTLTVTAHFTRAVADKPARLYVTANIEEDWHIYSLTQPKGGPLPSKIKLPKSDEFRLASRFTASPKAQISSEPEIWPDVEIQTHADKVTWYATIEFAPGVDPSQLTIQGKLNVQACNDRGCLPPKDYKFTAVLGEPVHLDEETPAK